MMSVRTPSGIKQAEAIRVRGASTLAVAETGRIRESGGLSVFFSPGASSSFVVSIPATAEGSKVADHGVGVSTNSVSAIVTGGSSPYSYLWERTDANPESWSILTPTSSSTSFRGLNVGPGEAPSATFKCTVTDANSDSAQSNELTATVYNYGTAP